MKRFQIITSQTNGDQQLRASYSSFNGDQHVANNNIWTAVVYQKAYLFISLEVGQNWMQNNFPFISHVHSNPSALSDGPEKSTISTLVFGLLPSGCLCGGRFNRRASQKQQFAAVWHPSRSHPRRNIFSTQELPLLWKHQWAGLEGKRDIRLYLNEWKITRKWMVHMCNSFVSSCVCSSSNRTSCTQSRYLLHSAHRDYPVKHFHWTVLSGQHFIFFLNGLCCSVDVTVGKGEAFFCAF